MQIVCTVKLAVPAVHQGADNPAGLSLFNMCEITLANHADRAACAVLCVLCPGVLGAGGHAAAAGAGLLLDAAAGPLKVKGGRRGERSTGEVKGRRISTVEIAHPS